MQDFLKANYHAHTVRCQHAYGTEREYIEAAIEMGMKEFGFSDHVPCPFKDGYVSGIRKKAEHEALLYVQTEKYGGKYGECGICPRGSSRYIQYTDYGGETDHRGMRCRLVV